MTDETAAFRIPRDRIEIRTSRSSGPGGQNVNKVESKVELRFHLASADWLDAGTRYRLAQNFPTRISKAGEFILACDEHRSQARNLEECFDRLRRLIVSALKPPKRRVKTKPTRGSRERRLDSKQRTGEKKKSRRGDW